ncbi:gluconate 2-dehydrogenase [Megasphaera cerevisiae DSM 20462]|jgi:D-3-phosphoglycerate dehydrogenase|uniref:Gluconate 2-dehydrogenase n=1 Tax=Megasphaera cerevisiae DSM 20462 TaxID=1122219 RepID=A0A0J6WTP2_9FIRM|nr:2-hydroxyacid dehydrogenase [Megasphaera cerevisiae]KMO85909.1 gluconate 2-dehydrogenase [Megasphaera cerevisiae DSM 20462]MCI1750246.1 2-hydroxyacid dehydrogenase [Megasphaera cerevisiae]OKY52327.1 gluconate 2-dehydrogenase [Megasphaera cerevisiae]SKA07811.1 D-3-phosphoglycerate dehydrogenase [Megasphaera cerevisiae DSM 20462]
MKLVGIGDLLIPADYIKKGFQKFADQGVEVKFVDWELQNYEELQNINLKIETDGCEEYEVPENLIDKISDADIIITQFCPINKKVMDACSNLKAIGVLRGGYENINAAYAKRKNILVYNTPGRNATAVADFTVGMILSECRNIAKAHCNLKAGRWVRDYANAASVPDLAGKIAGIIGLGQIGKKVAQRLHGFDMTILGYDPYAATVPEYVQLVSLDILLRKSDFITIHSRLTKDTEELMNADAFAKMKPVAYFINTARAGLVDETALYEALKSKKIMGAALDVFDKEPLGREYPLVQLNNVTITPHLAGGTVDAFLKSPFLLEKEMESFLHGKINYQFVINQK